MIVEDPALGQDAITRERDWHTPTGDAGSTHGLRTCASCFLPLWAATSLPFSSSIKERRQKSIKSIGLTELGFLKCLLHRFCLQRYQRALQAVLDIGDAFALKRSDFGDGPASSNPPKAGFFKWGKRTFLHDTNRAQLGRGRRRLWCGSLGRSRGGDAPEKSGSRRDLCDGSRGAPGGGWGVQNLDFSIRMLCYAFYRTELPSMLEARLRPGSLEARRKPSTKIFRHSRRKSD